MTSTPVAIGIDLACAKRKRLPICFADIASDRLTPLVIPAHLADQIPRGVGNAEVRSATPFYEVADAAARSVERICVENRRLAINYRPVSVLIPYARNARTHSDAQVAQIASSIRAFGWTNPILVDGENGIIAGHGRVLAARSG